MTVERHLVLRELTLLPSGEWNPRQPGWFVVQVAAGTGYCLQPEGAREINSGDCLVAVFNGKTSLRASQLGQLKLRYYLVDPRFVGGLLTTIETHQLETVLNHPRPLMLSHPAGSKTARDFAQVVSQSESGDLPGRCRLLLLWAEATAGLLAGRESNVAAGASLRARLRELVGRISELELISHSPGELAAQIHCSPRHFGRLFREEFGVSFRQRQIELRLRHASRLLSSSDTKIINVAYDSGYRHLGLFNNMFKKRFGITPGAWRRNAQKNIPARPHAAIKHAALLALLAGLLLVPAASAQTNAPSAPSTPSISPTSRLYVGTPADAADASRMREFLHQRMRELDAQEKAGTNTPAPVDDPSQTKFEVRRFDVHGNTLLKAATVEAILNSAKGTNITFGRIRDALGNLQMAYRERGFPTVAVTLPPQQLTNATVQVRVIEAPLTNIVIVGNRFFSSNNVMRALPSLQPMVVWKDMILNSYVFQRELDLANANRDRQIYPVLGPGAEPGTSELTLKVKDQLPLHGRLELNNQATPGTPDLRVNFNAQYANLWDREHQIGIQYGFTPSQLKSDKETYFASPFDAPLIANYSAYYRLPLGAPGSTEEQIQGAPSSFGYNEATHQFQLPSASGRPEITFYVSRSTTDTGVKFGPAQVTTGGSATNLLTITSRDSSEDLTLNEDLGARFILPLPESEGTRVSCSFGFDYKVYRKSSFSTNNFDIDITVPDPVTGVIIFHTNQNFALGSPPTFDHVDYLPLNLGFDFYIPDRLGASYLNTGVNFNFLPGFSGNKAFSEAAYSTNATYRYLSFNFGYTRDQRIYKDWSVLLRANGQLAAQPLIGNEQFALGGVASVRGYHEGEVYGDSGWRVSIEPRTPPLNLGMVGNAGHLVPLWVRASAFMDYGEANLSDTTAGGPSHFQLWGVGVAASANIGDTLDARLVLAVPLRSTPTTRAGQFGVFFNVGVQF